MAEGSTSSTLRRANLRGLIARQPSETLALDSMSWLRDRMGCAGGQAGYYAVRASAQLRNRSRPKRFLLEPTCAALASVFPKLDLGRVRIVEGASLPPNWLPRWIPGSIRADAMTFGYTIYFRAQCDERPEGRALLVHELVHVDQLRRRGGSERKFACDYGRGFLEAGNYRYNPMEVEAYDLEYAYSRGSL